MIWEKHKTEGQKPGLPDPVLSLNLLHDLVVKPTSFSFDANILWDQSNPHHILGSTCPGVKQASWFKFQRFKTHAHYRALSEASPGGRGLLHGQYWAIVPSTRTLNLPLIYLFMLMLFKISHPWTWWLLRTMPVLRFVILVLGFSPVIPELQETEDSHILSSGAETQWGHQNNQKEMLRGWEKQKTVIFSGSSKVWVRRLN